MDRDPFAATTAVISELPHTSTPKQNYFSYNREEIARSIPLLEEEALERGRERWNHIIAKYSNLREKVANDVVDIYSGKLIEDNGHLKSLQDHDADENGVILPTDLWRDDFTKLALPQRRMVAERLQELQKRHQRFGKFCDFVAIPSLYPPTADKESPTKKQRRGSPPKSSPIQANPYLSGISALKSVDSETALESPSKKTKERLFSYFDEYSNDTDDSLDSSKGYDSDSALVAMFEKASDVCLFLCAFPKCDFSSESKKDYEQHLISTHVAELSQLGYPVPYENSDHSKRISIPELSIMKLLLHFPLEWDLPREPLLCRINLRCGPCKKIFSDEKTMLEHQKRHTECSSKRQILRCPVLGCDYITEESYGDFLEHVNSHKRFTSILQISRVPAFEKLESGKAVEYESASPAIQKSGNNDESLKPRKCSRESRKFVSPALVERIYGVGDGTMPDAEIIEELFSD